MTDPRRRSLQCSSPGGRVFAVSALLALTACSLLFDTSDLANQGAPAPDAQTNVDAGALDSGVPREDASRGVESGAKPTSCVYTRLKEPRAPLTITNPKPDVSVTGLYFLPEGRGALAARAIGRASPNRFGAMTDYDAVSFQLDSGDPPFSRFQNAGMQLSWGGPYRTDTAVRSVGYGGPLGKTVCASYDFVPGDNMRGAAFSCSTSDALTETYPEFGPPFRNVSVSGDGTAVLANIGFGQRDGLRGWHRSTVATRAWTPLGVPAGTLNVIFTDRADYVLLKEGQSGPLKMWKVAGAGVVDPVVLLDTLNGIPLSFSEPACTLIARDGDQFFRYVWPRE